MKDSLVIENILRKNPHIIDGKAVECKIAIPKNQIDLSYQPNVHVIDKSKTNPLERKIFVGGLPSHLTEGKNYY